MLWRPAGGPAGSPHCALLDALLRTAIWGSSSSPTDSLDQSQSIDKQRLPITMDAKSGEKNGRALNSELAGLCYSWGGRAAYRIGCAMTAPAASDTAPGLEVCTRKRARRRSLTSEVAVNNPDGVLRRGGVFAAYWAECHGICTVRFLKSGLPSIPGPCAT